MTGALDAVARKVSSQLITKFGATITLTRVTEGVYDPSTGSTTNTETSETIIGVVDEYKSYDFVNGLAVAGDKKIICAASDVAKPNLADKLTVQGIVYSILNVTETVSGEQDALYTLQARRV
jgi:hypothetical protein